MLHSIKGFLSTDRARYSLALLVWPTPSPLRLMLMSKAKRLNNLSRNCNVWNWQHHKLCWKCKSSENTKKRMRLRHLSTSSLITRWHTTDRISINRCLKKTRNNMHRVEDNDYNKNLQYLCSASWIVAIAVQGFRKKIENLFAPKIYLLICISLSYRWQWRFLKF